ncbi:hypothetical protein RlegWSM1455_23530 [Rhizobium laguerreae]|uniref:hypothetical protein n=1 Tax=Rhizobium laguerreae TaxID=1076926 RepID=UPI001E30EA42|nr:hypothetical protein [Rhizobium laguerreae]UFW64423.1 hypothetical protein RlegWSM1455_23530 [Rhizobium laguerreae]
MRQLKRFSTSLHDEMMDSFVKPAWLIEGELRDSRWVIQTGSSPPETVDFDQQLTAWPNPKSLLDREFVSDLISLKIVILSALKPKPVGWCTAAITIARSVFKPQIVLLRWRIDQGIKSYSQLDASWFNKFDASMKDKAREGLLDLEGRARRVLKALSEGKVSTPDNGRGGIASNALARLLGVSWGVELTGPSRVAIEAHFASRGEQFSRAAHGRKRPVELAVTPTRETARNYYRTWFDLWRLRDALSHDPIGFQAFKTFRDLRKWVKKWAAAEPTPDAPAFQTCYLINACLSLLWDPLCKEAVTLVNEGIDHGGRMRNMKRLNRVNARLRKLGFPEIGPHYDANRWQGSNCLSVRAFVFVIVPAAARILTSAFSARRDDEINRSRIECIETDAANQFWLHCHIAKNLDRVDRIPVPKSVEQAVRIVKSVRALGGKSGDKLYDFFCPIRQKAVKFDVGLKLDTVASYFSVPPLEDGKAWHFSPHQFRKFFGVTYYWRWAFPDLTALSFHYRHFNPDTTRRYIEMKAAEALRMRDEKMAAAMRRSAIERKDDFRSCKTAFVAWIFDAVRNGASIMGPLGRRIEAEIKLLKEKFFPEMQVTAAGSENSFGDMLARVVSNTDIQIHPEGHSLCGCGKSREDALQSRCLTLKRLELAEPLNATDGPDFDYAHDSGCLVCPHRGQLRSMSAYWEMEYDKAEEGLSHASTSQAHLIRDRLFLIEDHALPWEVV